MESPRTVPSAWRNLHLACRQTSTRWPRVEQFKCHPRSPCVERQMAFRVSDLAESGAFSGGIGNLGKGVSRAPNRLSARTRATPMPKPDFSCPRGGATLPCATSRRDCHNERDLADGERRSGIRRQALFRVDIGSQHSTGNAKTYHRENMFHCRRAHSDNSPKNESAPDSSSHGTPVKQHPPRHCSTPT